MPCTARNARRSCHAFTLIELLIVVIILGVIAAIVIPKFSNASLEARENTLKEELRYMRSQMLVFKAQHRDVPPGFPGGDIDATPDATTFVEHMTMHSNQQGGISSVEDPNYPLGPYLTRIPRNPLNQLETVTIVPPGASFPAADNSSGWLIKPDSIEIRANSPGTDAAGRSYADY
jgi:general secretion pathway protein G